MATAEVHSVVVCPAAAFPSNAFVLGAAAAAPTSIYAVAAIDPSNPLEVESIPALAGYGAVAVRLNLSRVVIVSRAFQAAIDRLADVVAAADLVIQWTAPLRFARLIERVASRVPAVPLVLDHLGLPDHLRDQRALGRIRDLATIPTLHVKLSGMYAISEMGYPYVDAWSWAEAVVEAFGAERTMWGSDWPTGCESVTYAENLALVGLLPSVSEDMRQQIISSTAQRFWFRRAGSDVQAAERRDDPSDLGRLIGTGDEA